MKRHLVTIAALCWVSLGLVAQTHQHQPTSSPAAPRKPSPQQPPAGQPTPMPGMPRSNPNQQKPQTSGPPLTLENREPMAFEHNPTLKQADAEVRAAEGRKRQAGLYPNPTVGYQGEQIRGGSFGGGEQGAFVQQDIVLGGKLGAAKNVFEQERK